MTEWSLQEVLSSLHGDIQHRLYTARKSFAHPGVKGDASESVWLNMLKTYLPKRYQAERAHVVDSTGRFSDQIDIVIFDRQYSPFIFDFQNQLIVPAESVYAVFECKQTVNSKNLKYSHEKISSVRILHRTSLPIPHAGGIYPPKPLIHIIGGILSLESEWVAPVDTSLINSLSSYQDRDRIDFGCVASHGYFHYCGDAGYQFIKCEKPATSFLFALISRLQFSGTVPMIDIEKYGKWIEAF